MISAVDAVTKHGQVVKRVSGSSAAAPGRGLALASSDTCDLFFFQAEDGIRDLTVTGVQTCALPISVEEAVEEIRHGRMIVLVDDEDRENEGDLAMAAEKITPEAINFMAKYGRGLI